MSLGLAVGVGVSPFETGFAARNRFFSWLPGGVIAGESFTRAGTTAFYFDVNGVLQPTIANQKRDGHFIGGVRTMLLEGAATNIVLFPRDLTNAAWVHTTMTPAKDQTGIDGVLNSASSILATGANATSLQTIVLASSTRAQQAWVKRLVGAGAVSMTMDNVTFTVIPVTAQWTKVTIPSQAALVNPVVGFKLAVSGDQIAVDFVDNETGTVNTSPKIGTRNVETYTLPFGVPPQMTSFFMKYIEVGPVAGQRVFNCGASGGANLRVNRNNPSPPQVTHNNGGTSVNSQLGGAAPAVGDTVEIVARLFTDGSIDGIISINGAAQNVGPQSAANAPAAAWVPQSITPNSDGAGSPGSTALIALKVLAGTRTLAEMRAA